MQDQLKTVLSQRTFPLVGWKREGNAYQWKCKGKVIMKDVSPEVPFKKLVNFVRMNAYADCCINVCGRPIRTCNCLHYLLGREIVIHAVAQILLNFFDMKNKDQIEHCIDSLKQAAALKKEAQLLWKHDSKKGPAKTFPLPVLSKERGVGCDNGKGWRDSIINDRDHKICISAWTTLHNVGNSKLRRLQNIMKGNADASLSIIDHKCNTLNRFPRHSASHLAYESMCEMIQFQQDSIKKQKLVNMSGKNCS